MYFHEDFGLNKILNNSTLHWSRNQPRSESVSEIEGLKSRVEQAVEQLSSVQDARRDQTQNLTGLLSGAWKKSSGPAPLKWNTAIPR